MKRVAIVLSDGAKVKVEIDRSDLTRSEIDHLLKNVVSRVGSILALCPYSKAELCDIKYLMSGDKK